MRLQSQQLGVFVPGQFAVPQNPVGLGDVSSSITSFEALLKDAGNFLTDEMFPSIPNYALVAAGIAAYYIFSSVSGGVKKYQSGRKRRRKWEAERP